MLLRELTNNINQGKATAVLGWGRGMGHKGHMLLAQSVIHYAHQLKAEPYFVVSRTSVVDPSTGDVWADRAKLNRTKEDPLTPNEKLAIYKKVFPDQSHIFSVATEDATKLEQVMAKLAQQGFKNIVLVVGGAEKEGFGYLTKPDKTGASPIQQMGLASLKIVSRQDTKAPGSDVSKPDYQEGPRATPLRQVLLDPSKSEQEQFAMWRRDMPDHLSDEEVMHLMQTAKARLIKAHTPAVRGKKAVAEAEKNPHTSALGKALYRDLSKEKKASPEQVQRNKERWAQRQAEREQGVTEMDKSQTPPGRDGNQQSPRDDRQSRGRDTGPRSGPDRVAKPVSKQKATRDMGAMFNQAFTDSHKKKGVAEGSDYSKELNLSKMSVDELKNHIEELTNAATEWFGMERSYIRMDIDKAKTMLRRKLKPGVVEATGDERFDTMMGQIQREPRIPDAQMPPTDVKDLYQWAVKHHKPYHKIFAKWANREGYKSVAPALQKAGNLDSDALDYWTPDVWKLWYGPDAEMPRHWSKERVPDELRDYLETVFDAYENIWQDWPTEYRQIGDRGVNEGTKGREDPLSASIKQAGPYAKRYDDMADTFYPMYRFGIAIAGDKDTPSAGPVRAVPTIWMRNAEEAEIVAKAERTVGIKGTVVVPNGDSEELPDTNSVSAVAKPKRNRYGI
jgi:hypothetical protein